MDAPPFFNLQEDDDSLFNYLNNSLSPLKTTNYAAATQTLNSLGMDYSLFTSPDVTFLDASKAHVSSENENIIYSHEDSSELHGSTAKMISTEDYSFELSRQQAMQYGSCSPEHHTLISSDDVNYLLGLLGEQDSVEVGTFIPELGQVEENIEVPDYDYNNLFTTIQSLTPMPQFITNSNYKMQTFDSVAYCSSIHGTENNLYEPIVAAYRNQTWDNLANVALMDSNPIERGKDELVSIRRGIEMGLLEYEKTSYTSNISSCSSNSDEWNASNEKPLFPRKNTSDSQRCVLQGNGFFLNAIPTSNQYKGIENEMMFSGRNPELPSCTYSLDLSASEGHRLSQVLTSTERHLEPSENEVQATKDLTKSSVHIPGEDFCQSTLKMKSKQLDPPNMRKKRKSQIDLSASCSKHEKEEESADFGQSNPKKKRKINKSGHCKCQKSSCLMKHCECFKGGVGCSPSCKCQGCENTYGRKDSEAETKPELEETEALQISRSLLPLPYLSLGNLQRSCAELFGSQNEELVESNAIGSIFVPPNRIYT